MTVKRVPITDRGEWLKNRRRYVGASEVAILAGKSDYKTVAELAAEKRGLIEPPAPTLRMKQGLAFESANIEMVKEECSEWEIIRPGLWLHDDETRLACTPDAVILDPDGPAILQLKLVARPIYEARWRNPDPNEEDVPPEEYVLQTLTEAMLWGTQQAYISALIVDTYSAEVRLFQVQRHPMAELRILKLVKDFWDKIDRNEDFPFDWGRDRRLIELLHPPSEGSLDLTGDNRIHELLADRAELKEQIRLNTKDVDAIDAEIVAKLHGATHAFVPGWTISRKLTHRSEYVVPAKSYPVLRITERKEPR